MTEAEMLLRDLRPDPAAYDPDAQVSQRWLEALLVSVPPGPPAPRRPVWPRIVLVAVAAALALVVLAGVSLPGRPDVLARAADAVDADGAILHFVARERSSVAREGIDERDAASFEEHTVEVWQTDERRQERLLVRETGFEAARDIATRTSLTYVRERDELIRDTSPELFRPDPARDSLGTVPLTPAAAIRELPRLLQRARDGDERVRITGETTVGGVPVHELRMDFDIEVYDRPDPGAPHGIATRTEQASRVIYVDRANYEPVRLVERGPSGTVARISDFLTVERLPRTDDNVRLLRMSAHPGAREVER